MKDYEILDAIGGIDSRFVEKAAERRNLRPVWKYILPAAACFAVLVGAFCVYPKFGSALLPAPDPFPGGNIERTDMPETYPEHPIL